MAVQDDPSNAVPEQLTIRQTTIYTAIARSVPKYPKQPHSEHSKPCISHRTWSEPALARIDRLYDRVRLMRLSEDQESLVCDHLRKATEAVERRHNPYRAFRCWWGGCDADRVWRNLHQADSLLLQFMAPTEFRARLLRYQAYINTQLGGNPDWSPALNSLKGVVERYNPADLSSSAQENGNSAAHRNKHQSMPTSQDARLFTEMMLRIAHRVDDDSNTRLREYRNILWAAFVTTGFLAAALLTAAKYFPRAFELWLALPNRFEDIGAIMLFGVLGATLSILRTLPHLPSFKIPYSLGTPQLLLKVSSGILTSFIGVMFLESGWIPWVKIPVNGSEVALAAIIFGYMQQFITRFVD